MKLTLAKEIQAGRLACALAIGLTGSTLASPANVLSLDGVNDFVAAGSSIFPSSSTGFALQSFTVECWIYPRSAGSEILGDDAYDLVLFFNPNAANDGVGIKFTVWSGGGGVSSVSVAEFRDVRLNQWNHVAASFDVATKQMRIAINGNLDAPGDPIDISSFYTDSSQQFTAGRLESSNFGAFDGYIDEIRISDNVRYTSNFTPENRFSSDSHTKALFHFDEASGAGSFADASGNGHTLTARNGATVAVQTRPGDEPPPVIDNGIYAPASDAVLLDLTSQGLGYLVVPPGEAISVGENGTDQPGDRGWLAFALNSQARTNIANSQTIYLNLTPSSRIDLESANVYVDIEGLTNRTSATASDSDYLASGVVLVGQAVTSISPRTNLSFDVTSFVKAEAARSSSSVIAFRLQMGPSVPYLDGAFNQFNFFSAESTNTAARPTLMLNGQPRITGPMLGSGGGFQFQLFGAIRSTYVIQASTNLTTWTPFATNGIPAAGFISVIDAVTTNYTSRYYRAVTP